MGAINHTYQGAPHRVSRWRNPETIERPSNADANSPANVMLWPRHARHDQDKAETGFTNGRKTISDRRSKRQIPTLYWERGGGRQGDSGQAAEEQETEDIIAKQTLGR